MQCKSYPPQVFLKHSKDGSKHYMEEKNGQEYNTASAGGLALLNKSGLIMVQQ